MPTFALLSFLSPSLFQSSNRWNFRTQEKRPHSDCIKYRNGSRRRFGGFIRWSWILTTDSNRPPRWKDHNSIGLFLASNSEISQENSLAIQKKKKYIVVFAGFQPFTCPIHVSLGNIPTLTWRFLAMHRLTKDNTLLENEISQVASFIFIHFQGFMLKLLGIHMILFLSSTENLDNYISNQAVGLSLRWAVHYSWHTL